VRGWYSVNSWKFPRLFYLNKSCKIKNCQINDIILLYNLIGYVSKKEAVLAEQPPGIDF